MTPVSQLAPAKKQAVAPTTSRQTRSHGPTDIVSLVNQSPPPDAIQRKPQVLANPVNTFVPIATEVPSQEDNEVALSPALLDSTTISQEQGQVQTQDLDSSLNTQHLASILETPE